MGLRSFYSACALLIAASFANAATLTFDFVSSLLTVRPGETASFSGTVTNTGAGAAFLNGDSFTFPLPVDDTPFLLGAPVSLAPGGSFSALFVRVPVSASTLLGLYAGSFSIVGGDTANDRGVLATREFGVQVVPEPSSLGLCLLALTGWIMTLTY